MSLLLQKEVFCPVVYWPSENGTSKQFGTIIISNNIFGVDFKNKNILFRELELSVEDSDYVRLDKLNLTKGLKRKEKKEIFS